MSSSLRLQISNWYDNLESDDVSEQATFAELSIHLASGGGEYTLTEIYDDVQKSTRPHIYVGASVLAEWLVMHWWRLRYEPDPSATGNGEAPAEWRLAHEMSSAGSGYVWPPIRFESDGEQIFLSMRQRMRKGSDSYKYLCDFDGVKLPLSALAFEAGVDEFLNVVLARLDICGVVESDLAAMRAELAHERNDPNLARQCKLQAMAGYDPGDAPDGWLSRVASVEARVGQDAACEVMPALSRLPSSLDTADEILKTMEMSKTELDGSVVAKLDLRAAPHDVPWRRGAACARQLRSQLAVSGGVFTTDGLLDAAGLSELPEHARGEGFNHLFGAIQKKSDFLRFGVLCPFKSVTGKRFFLARLLGAVVAKSDNDRLLALTKADTAHQKFTRAFAQELLCPWDELRPFIEERGADEEGIEEAAEYFQVSTLTINSTLTNKGYWNRSPAFE